jgi:hypothetical protein
VTDADRPDGSPTPTAPGIAARTADISRKATFPSVEGADAGRPEAGNAATGVTGAGIAETTVAAADAAETAPPRDASVGAAPARPESPAAPGSTVERVEVQRRGGFLPGFLGGIAAVAGGLFAAPYVMPEAMRPATTEDLAALEARIGEVAASVEPLTARVEEVAQSAASPEDVQSLADEIAQVRETLDGDVSALSSTVEEVDSRLATLEAAPVEDNPDPAVVAALERYREAVAGYETSVEELRASVEAQVAAAMAEADATRAEAEAESQAAAERAAEAARQRALADLRAALDAGDPYADALAEFDGETVPQALSASAGDGVATLAALQESFAPAAREALAVARETMPAGEGAERVGNFLAAQLGVRSLAPKEGDSPDAILARAQAAVTDGELAAALDEIAALPEAARAPLADWTARARARVDAVTAVNELAASLTAN